MGADNLTRRRTRQDNRPFGPQPPDRCNRLSEAAHVLVLGATGFIGGHAATALQKAGHRVTGTSRSGEGGDLECDLLEPLTLETALSGMRPDAVVMAAGMSSVRLAWDDPPAAFASNSRGVFNLLEALGRSAPDAHLTMLSSASVYGPPESLPLTEESAAEPSSPYGASKLAAEMLCRQHARRHGTGVAVLRLFNSIGPGQGTGQAPSEFARQIAIAEKRGERGLMITVGNPDSERDFTDVRDVADGIAGAVSGRLEGTFNLCSGRAATIGSIVHGLNLATRVEVGMLVDPERAHPADVTSLYGSCQKLGTAIGFAPKTVLEQSLEDLLEDWRTRA